MSNIRVPTFLQKPVAPRSNARNGRFPSAAFAKSMADLTNQAILVRTKEVARFFTHVTQTPSSPMIPNSGGAGERNRWISAFHSSPFVNRLWAIITLAQSTTAGRNPYGRIRCETMAPATVGDATVYAGTTATNGTNTDTPAFFASIVVPFIDPSDGSIVTIPADTDLTLTFSDFDDARMLSATVFEEAQVPDTLTGYVDANVSVLAPIIDATREQIATRLNAQWKAGAAHLFNWAADSASAAVTTTSSTAKNLVDRTSTTVAFFTPGYTLDLTNTTRLSTTTSGTLVTMWVNAKDSTAGNGTVQLVDGGASVMGSITGFTTSQTWQSTTFFLPAAVAKYDLQFKTSAGTLTVYAVSVYMYEA